MFQQLKKLQQNDKINLLELKESYKQNVTIIDNDTDKKLLLIECNGTKQSLCYSQIKSIKIMGNKSAMQELIDKLEIEDFGMYEIYSYLQLHKNRLLEKEKQQIENAVTYGNRQEFYDGTETLGQNYYSITFKNK